ncbi:uncharacterized protein BJ212DRAFT_1448021 [Suillus subaureus]|uniref:CxC2-like cysteine cluster KDZ transposase-associated domain-containing protein n=1 Tax=Suillus subaureus TaxID=48587 RepID=A0A9P7E728_9AGAM|nr:uncharacterized protein BJ212DRAFT_1448021 [Suillus subaureus]KAG1812790.1 hypothetical protein BJ212DRAFT_1448021 [Suillus subaureus]
MWKHITTKEGVGHKSPDYLLSTPGVVENLSLSFHNSHTMHQIINTIPSHSLWHTAYLSFPDNPEEQHMVQYRGPLEAICTLLGNPAHAETIIYKPCKVFSDESKENRIYSEMWMGKWWHALQEQLPEGSVVTLVIIATDKTQLTKFSGSKSAYPMYLTLGNIPRAIRCKPSQQACILVGYLSMDKISNSKLSKKEKMSRIQCLFHDSMCTILEHLKEAGHTRMDMVCGDGKVQRIHPILACYMADYLEQCLVTCVKYGTCPKCQSPVSELGSNTPGELHTQAWTMGVIKDAKAKSHNLHKFHSLCQSKGVSGMVQHPFWEGFPYFNIHLSMTPNNGWSELSQISDRERKEMAHILLGCLVGKVLRRVILAYHSLLDFIYLAQYPTHDDHTLGYLQDALDVSHKHKAVLIELGVRDHFNIPKIHSLTHYINSIHMFGAMDNYNTEAFECLHINFAKNAWRTTNKRDELPQMASWLDRYENVLGKTPNPCETNPWPHISISKRPHHYGQSLQDIMESPCCPGLIQDIKNYLNQLQRRAIGEGLGYNRLEMMQLPFEKLDVYHGFKFVLEELGEDAVDDCGPNDWVRACPKTRGPHG